MSILTKNEEILMMAVWRLKNDAYGVKIKQYVSKLTGKEWNYGTLYCSLDQMVRKDYLKKWEGDPLPQRGGRRKIYYALTQEGVDALQSAQRLQKALWDGVSAHVQELRVRAAPHLRDGDQQRPQLRLSPGQ